MSEARRLILHIGLPKTGSSAIQAWLARNAPALARHGIAYLNFRPEAADDRITSGNGQRLQKALDRPRAEAADWLGRELLSLHFGEHATAIVSNEGLARLSADQGGCCAISVPSGTLR